MTINEVDEVIYDLRNRAKILLKIKLEAALEALEVDDDMDCALSCARDAHRMLRNFKNYLQAFQEDIDF